MYVLIQHLKSWSRPPAWGIRLERNTYKSIFYMYVLQCSFLQDPCADCGHSSLRLPGASSDHGGATGITGWTGRYWKDVGSARCAAKTGPSAV